ncbi:LOW QUALITY PROTEIN: uncharacterized protein LOC128302116 [Anopheles moucheti]|uniref:LOW QUALITY PROTEIN: uncharacterized protein LOC128302116 n=1 Tax=Anopheles moucheti TaxID=186751 RepID=UPI0022F060A5|nr:LOW QUALITY PROTEIN: uncharacterized protein LOC128302116 [Anopheles moucheti]
MSTPIFITVPTKYIPINVAPAVVAKPSTTPTMVKPLAKRPTSVAPSSVASDDESSSMDEFIVRGKKRRLDHLTWEEKIQRKKLKNRVAAQTSRDRKKAKMEEMEKTIEEQSEQIMQLQNRCSSLDTEKGAIYDKYLDLERRFEDLQKRLLAQEQKLVKEEPQEDDVIAGDSVGCVTAGRQSGSAASPRCSAAGTVQVRSGGSANDTAPDSERSSAIGHLEDHCDLPTLQDMFENFDVSHLEELAESLLAGIGADLEDIDRASRSADAKSERTSQRLSGSVVGPTTAIVESGRPETPTGNRLILTTHNYSKSPFYELADAPQLKQEQEEHETCPDPAITLQNTQPAAILPNSDTLYGTYDNETNSITIVLADDEAVSETTVTCMDGQDVDGPSEEIILLEHIEHAEEETMETTVSPTPLSSVPLSPLPPITIRSPSPLRDLLSPISQQPLKSPGGFSSVSDAGYESLGSPTPASNASETIPSDPYTMSLDYALGDDFNEFWNLDPLFPILE